MSFLSWCSARCGGISLILLSTLCLYVLFDAFLHSYGLPRHASTYASRPYTTSSDRPFVLSYIFAFYSLIVHGCVVMFQLRACWAVVETTKGLRKASHQVPWVTSRLHQSWELSSESPEISEVASSHSSRSSIDGWASGTDSEDDLELVTHAIIIPNYKEDIDVLMETLDILASHPQARYAYDIFLAMEARELEADKKASELVAKFKNKFRLITTTFHPGNIPGESPGKSSNLKWAAKRASEEYELASRKDVVLTSIDADSHLSWRFFSEITAMHLAFPDTSSTTLYAAPIIFDRNANEVPAVVRVADIAWCAAGLSGQYRGSSICPPTSVYSIPLELADRVCGWDAGPEAIGEDLHMYLKCFFALNGNLIVRPVTCPVSQTNITGSGTGTTEGVYARYRQALRHMWGSLDSGYALVQLIRVWQRRNMKQEVYWPLHFSLKSSKQDAKDTYTATVSLPPPHWLNIFFLFHRLFEAHFMPAHIFILVVATSIYRHLASTDLGPIAWIFQITDILSFTGFLATIRFFYCYQTYHHLALRLRQSDIAVSDSDEKMQVTAEMKVWRNVLDCIWLPFVAPLYGSLPAIHAQLMHFWTTDLVYVVSNKPIKAKAI